MDAPIIFFAIVGLLLLGLWAGLFVFMTRKKKSFRVMTEKQEDRLEEKKRYPTLDPERQALGEDGESLDAEASGVPTHRNHGVETT